MCTKHMYALSQGAMISTFRRGFFRRALRLHRLPKKSLWTKRFWCGRSPIPPTNATYVTEFYTESGKTGRSVFRCLYLICCLPYSPKLPQLPRETFWRGQIRSWVRPTPPTTAHMVTENDLHWEKSTKNTFYALLKLFAKSNHLRHHLCQNQSSQTSSCSLWGLLGTHRGPKRVHLSYLAEINMRSL